MDKEEQQLLIMGVKLDQQRHLLRRVQSVHEFERREWAGLLHDEFGQSLAAIKSFAVGIKSSVEETHDAHELASIIQTTADQLYICAYDLMRSLRSGFIDDLGLLGGVKACIDNTRLSQQGILCELYTEGELETLGYLLNVAVLRIVQDSLIMIVRSMTAHKIIIRIRILQQNPDERRKHQREIEGNRGVKLTTRKTIEIQISGDLKTTMELDLPSEAYTRTRDYVEALGGEHLVEIKNLDFDVKVNLDVTDLITSDTE